MEKAERQNRGGARLQKEPEPLSLVTKRFRDVPPREHFQIVQAYSNNLSTFEGGSPLQSEKTLEILALCDFEMTFWKTLLVERFESVLEPAPRGNLASHICESHRRNSVPNTGLWLPLFS